MRTDPSPADSRLLIQYLRPERRPLAALLALLVVAMLLPLAGPLLIGAFVNAALGGESGAQLAALGGLFLLSTLTGDALQLVVTWFSVRLAWRVGNRLRLDLCRHALGLDLDWHGDHSAGQLIERIDGDVDAVTRFSSTAVLQLGGNAILVAGVLVISAVIDWRASLLIALTVAIAVAVLIRMRRVAVPFYDEEREVQSHLYGDLEERLSGLEDIRANGAGAWAVQKLHHHSAGWWRTARRAAARGDGGLTLAGGVFAAGSVAVLALSAWQCRQGELSVGSVLALLRFSQMVSDPLWRVAEQLAEAQKAIAGTRRAARLLAEESALPDGSRADLPDGPPSLAFDHVSFGYGTGTDVLHDVTFRVPAGTTVGVVGRTGSGKTTIGRLLARLWDAEAGTVSVGGIDVRDLAADELRRRRQPQPGEGFAPSDPSARPPGDPSLAPVGQIDLFRRNAPGVSAPGQIPTGMDMPNTADLDLRVAPLPETKKIGPQGVLARLGAVGDAFAMPGEKSGLSPLDLIAAGGRMYEASQPSWDLSSNRPTAGSIFADTMNQGRERVRQIQLEALARLRDSAGGSKPRRR